MSPTLLSIVLYLIDAAKEMNAVVHPQIACKIAQMLFVRPFTDKQQLRVLDRGQRARVDQPLLGAKELVGRHRDARSEARMLEPYPSVQFLCQFADSFASRRSRAILWTSASAVSNSRS